MQKYFHKKISLVIVIIFAAVIGVGFWLADFRQDKITPAHAGILDNVSGFAWSENYGAISFNSIDCDIDGDQVFEGDNEGIPAGSTPAPAGCPASSPPPFINYGVKITLATGDFFGYAWSSNVGWVSFQEGGGTPFTGFYNFSSNCEVPAACDGIGDICTACINKSTYKVYGWAKVLALGNDGWVKLSDDSVGTWSNKGVKISSTPGPTQGDFSGWAWNGNDNGNGIGWVSFNGDDCDNSGVVYSGTPAGCPPNGTSFFDYKVSVKLNNTPTVTPQAPRYSDLCSQSLFVILPWVFSDLDPLDTQDGYHIQIKTTAQLWTDDPSTFVKNVTVDPDTGPASQYAFDTGIFYGTTYNWRIQVKDNNDAWSSPWSYGADFTTAQHDYPTVNFTWQPQTPSLGEAAQFTDTSTADGGASITGWLWSFNNGAVVPPSTTGDQNPIAAFTTISNASATLIATDSTGYSCTRTIPITVKKKLPSWIETK